MRCPLSMKAGRAGFGVSPPQIANYSPNPRLTGRGHIWLQPVEEQRQRLGVVSWGWSPPRCCLDADRSPVDQHLPQACSPSHSTTFPRSVPGAPAATWRPPARLLLLTTPLHTPVCPPQVCKPSVNYIPGCQQLPSCPPRSPPALRASSYSMCLVTGNLAGNPLQGPWGPDPQQPALAPLPCRPLAHAPTESSLNTPGCYTCVQGQALFPMFHGLLNPISSFRSLPGGILAL